VKAVKFSKTTWIFLGVGTFLLAAFILGWVYLQKVDQQQQLASRLSQAQRTLAGIKLDDLSASRDPYIRQIAQYTSQIKETKALLTCLKNNLDASDDILASARASGVKITEMNSSGVGSEDLSGTPCQIIPITFKVSGDLNILAAYIANLSQIFPSCILKSTKIEQDEKTSKYKATVTLVIYNYKGK
jgi:hypothetical protein